MNSSRWQDAIAGISIAGLLLPEAVAYSSIANLPPQAGLIALFAGLACYALLGTSRYAIVSATSSSAAVLATVAAAMAGSDDRLRLLAASALVISTGAFFLVASLARLGQITDFIAKPVLRGFAFGLAIVIIVKQLAGVVAVRSVHTNVLQVAADLLFQVSDWNRVGIAACAVALGLLYLLGWFRHVPAGLIVIALGIAANHWLGLAQYGIGVVGAIHLQLAAPALPGLSRLEWLRAGELGLAVVLVLYSESYGSIRSMAMKHGDATEPNRDLLALGVANLVSGLFHGTPVGAGYSATSANEAAGAASKLAGVTAALVVLALVFTVLPLIALTPDPVLAAIVIHAVGHTLSPALFRTYFTWHRDRIVVVAAVLAVLLLGILDGLLVAIGISLLMLLRRLSESTIVILGRLGEGHDFLDMARHPDARAIAGIIIIRPDEALFFANVDRVLVQIQRAVIAAGPEVHSVVVSLEETPDLDGTSLEALRDFFDLIEKSGKRLFLARLKHSVLEILTRVAPCASGARVFSGLSVDDAVQLAQQPAGTLAGAEKLA